MHNNSYDTLSQATDDLKKRGYTINFRLKPDSIEDTDSGGSYEASEFTIDEFHRFEGMTNPADMSIVYAVHTEDGKKGTLVEAFGTYEDPLEREMLNKLKTS